MEGKIKDEEQKKIVNNLMNDDSILDMVARAFYNQLRYDLDTEKFVIDENNNIVPGPNFNATKTENKKIVK